MKQTKLKTIPLSSIALATRVRQDMGKAPEGSDSFEALKKSIADNGLIEPLVVIDLGSAKYRLIAGGRRLEALKQLKWTDVPCHVFPVGTTEVEEAVLELLENIDRKNLSWQETTSGRAKIDALMKEKHGVLPKGLNKTNASGEVDKRWSTEDSAKLLGVSSRAMQKAIELNKAMEVFPEDIAKAPSAQAAEAKLERIKAETGIPLVDKSDPGISGLQDAIRNKIWYKKDWKEAADKLRNWNPNLLLLTQEVNEETFAELLGILGPNGWIVSTSGKPIPQQKLLIYTWPPHVDVAPQELQRNYRFFAYTLKGSAVLNKPGRSALFSFKPVPPNIRVSDTELPIEFWQEVVETFVGKNGRVFIPHCAEGNMLLGAINAGAAPFGFNTDDALFDTFIKKVDQYSPGQYTSYPGSLKGKEVDDL